MPSNARAAAADANRRGVSLHRQGRVEEAIDAFREGIASQSGVAELHTNLGAALMQLGRFDEARTEYERVLEIQPDDLLAHSAMYELEQIRGDSAKAVTHQARVLARQTLFSQIAPREVRSVLALMAPGDWQANVPIDFLIDRETTTVHKFYVLSAPQAAGAALPSAGVVFTAIAESDENQERLRVAGDVAARLRLPVINRPERVLGTSRTRVWQALHDIPDVVVPQTVRRSKAELERGEIGVEYPLVIRPVGSHAGHELERLNDARDLTGYLDRSCAEHYYLMPFVDFSKEDGFFRKYRIIVVDGVPYAYHLAISPRWMIHYYNAPMREHAWMRDEERRFLDDFPSVFEPALVRAIGEMARRLGLEYFGIDCSIDRQGRLVLFEADPAMIVHAGDDPQLFAYKIPAAKRVFAAFERLIDRVGSR